REFERYLALKALEQYPDELDAYLADPAANLYPASHLLWAIQALPKPKKEAWFFPLWERARMHELDEPTFIWMSKMLDHPKVYAVVKPLFEAPEHAAKYLDIAVRNQQQIQSPELSSAL